MHWKRNDIIREKESGKPFLVIQVIKSLCTLVVDAKSREKTPSPLLIWERNYVNYANDRDLKAIEKEDIDGDISLDWKEEPSIAFI